jgi:hypothetical protein
MRYKVTRVIDLPVQYTTGRAGHSPGMHMRHRSASNKRKHASIKRLITSAYVWLMLSSLVHSGAFT